MKCMKEFNFEEIINEKYKMLEDVTEMVLSTCSENRVTSRVVSTACYGSKVIFLSWGHHTKCTQMRINPRVALCYNNFQIEGIASIMGRVTDKNNANYAQLYQAKQSKYFDIFSRFEGMQIIEIEIQSISYFGFEGMSFYVDRINLINKIAYREDLEQN